MKNSIVSEFIKSALILSSPSHWKATTNALRVTLKKSNYPSYLIESKINSVKRFLTENSYEGEHNENERGCYMSCPYYHDAMCFVRVKRDLDVNNIIVSLLSNRFCDKDEALAFQHAMYSSLMNIEISSLRREMTKLNEICAKERRFLKTITFDDVFKMCNNFLSFKKASDTISEGRKNEMLWKLSCDDKEVQTESIEKWLNIVSHVNAKYPFDEVDVENQKLKALTVSVNKGVNIQPVVDTNDSMWVDEFSNPFESTIAKDNEQNLLEMAPESSQCNIDRVASTIGMMDERNTLRGIDGEIDERNANTGDSVCLNELTGLKRRADRFEGEEKRSVKSRPEGYGKENVDMMRNEKRVPQVKKRERDHPYNKKGEGATINERKRRIVKGEKTSNATPMPLRNQGNFNRVKTNSNDRQWNDKRYRSFQNRNNQHNVDNYNYQCNNFRYNDNNQDNYNQ